MAWLQNNNDNHAVAFKPSLVAFLTTTCGWHRQAVIENMAPPFSSHKKLKHNYGFKKVLLIAKCKARSAM